MVQGYGIGKVCFPSTISKRASEREEKKREEKRYPFAHVRIRRCTGHRNFLSFPKLPHSPKGAYFGCDKSEVAREPLNTSKNVQMLRNNAKFCYVS